MWADHDGAISVHYTSFWSGDCKLGNIEELRARLSLFDAAGSVVLASRDLEGSDVFLEYDVVEAGNLKLRVEVLTDGAPKFFMTVDGAQ